MYFGFLQMHHYESSPDFLTCQKHIEDIYSACIVSCDPGDFGCIAACTRDLDHNLLNCPCGVNCPNGCSCDDYECLQTTTDITTATPTITTTMTSSTSVLILNTATSFNLPVITDATGRVDTDYSVSFDENTSVHYSCSVTTRKFF